jgi:opacity protein-like surface antigen
MIKRLILVCMVVLLSAPFASAQLWKMKRYEVSGGLGTSQFYGDIGGFSIGENALGLKDITFKQTRFNVNGSFRYFFTDNITARLSLTYVMFHATDMRGSNDDTRQFESSTSLFEPALVGEYYFVRNRERNSFLFQTYRSVSRRRISASDIFRSLDIYVVAGIGGARYNVFKANDRLEAKWASDPTLQRSGFTAVIPAGAGAKLTIDPNILIGVELLGRYAFSDYLDGYTSQWSKRNDVYHTFSVTFNYRIKTARNGLPSFK